MMPGKADKPTQNSALQGISEQENFMIRVPVHRGTREKLAQAGIACEGHHARQMTRADYDGYDYLIGMDEWNICNIKRITGGDPEGKIFKMMSFAGSSRDVADPWYTGDFEATWKDVTEGCQGLLQYILEENGKASKK